MSGCFGRRMAISLVKKISGLPGYRDEFSFARDLMVSAGRRHQVPHVVHLEVKTIREGLCRFVAIASRDKNRSVNIPVGTLRFSDHRDDLIEPLIPFWITLD